jgi:hypothetical protein
MITKGRQSGARGLPYFEDQTRDLILKSLPAIEALARALLARETVNKRRTLTARVNLRRR